MEEMKYHDSLLHSALSWSRHPESIRRCLRSSFSLQAMHEHTNVNRGTVEVKECKCECDRVGASFPQQSRCTVHSTHTNHHSRSVAISCKDHTHTHTHTHTTRTGPPPSPLSTPTTLAGEAAPSTLYHFPCREGGVVTLSHDEHNHTVTSRDVAMVAARKRQASFRRVDEWRWSTRATIREYAGEPNRITSRAKHRHTKMTSARGSSHPPPHHRSTPLTVPPWIQSRGVHT
jgi:hypothetical protein